MHFSAPAALLLLLILIPIIILGWPDRRAGRRRAILSLALRSSLFILVVLALAGLEFLSPLRGVWTVFVLDRSDSIQPLENERALEYIDSSLAAMQIDDRAALVVFGRQPYLEHEFSPSWEQTIIRTTLDASASDLASALQLAQAIFPSDQPGRIVLLSDGRPTLDNLDSIAQSLRQSNLELFYLNLDQAPEVEVALDEIRTPSLIRQGEQFNLEVSISASQRAESRLRVFARQELVHDSLIALEPGRQTISIPILAQSSGFQDFSVQIDPLTDTYFQNNRLSTYAEILGPPRVLIVAPEPGESIGLDSEPRPDESAALLAALQGSDLEITLLNPSRAPFGDLPRMREFDAIVLVDVPARRLSTAQMESLQSYVRDVGAGLIAIGGPTSFGVGGYFRTPLETTLPVEMQIQNEQRRTPVTIIFVIDQSGSMGETVTGVSKLDLAKEAVIRSSQLLFPGDRAGVLSFDTQAYWVFEPDLVDDSRRIEEAVATIGVGGGTHILNALQTISHDVDTDAGEEFHVILLTDGEDDRSGLPELAQSMREDQGITLTTVSISPAPNPLLQEMADLGGGRFHYTSNPESIPAIFSEETALISRSYLVEETFFPALLNSSPILDGITALPPLHGYVATSAKDLARTILVSEQNDPILASWQYGLGRSVAFTSDASGRWARDWVTWNGFNRFWEQNLRFVLGQPARQPVEFQITETQSGAFVEVEARSAQGRFLNQAQLELSIIGPNGAVETQTLRQSAPGRYEASFAVSDQGTYLVQLSGENELGSINAATAWDHQYGAEYRLSENNNDPWDTWLRVAQGQEAPAEPAQIFERPLPFALVKQPVWPWILSLAALLLPLDIAVRRLIISRRDIRAALDHLWRQIRPLARPARQMPPSEPVQAFREAKARARRRKEIKINETRAAHIAHESTSRLADDRPRPDEAEPPAKKTPNIPQPEEKPASTAAHLLARKRARRSDDEPDEAKHRNDDSSTGS